MASVTLLGIYLASNILKPSKPAGASPSAGTNSTNNSQTNKVRGLPVRLKIPSIKVDAALEYVSLQNSGELGAPTLPHNAAWYAQGPAPGQLGNAVINGHYGWAGNKPAVFDNLSKLHQGNKIFVLDDHGLTLSFMVTKIRTMAQDQNAKEAFVSNDKKSHLVLITCKGNWDKADRSYSDRLVVFADKID